MIAVLTQVGAGAFSRDNSNSNFPCLVRVTLSPPGRSDFRLSLGSDLGRHSGFEGHAVSFNYFRNSIQ